MAAHGRLLLVLELAASSELQLTRAVLAVVPVLIHGELGQVQLPGADVATPRVVCRRGVVDILT